METLADHDASTSQPQQNATNPAVFQPRRSARQVAARAHPDAAPESELAKYDQLGPPEVIKDTDGVPSKPKPTRRKATEAQPLAPAAKKSRKNGPKEMTTITTANNSEVPAADGPLPPVELPIGGTPLPLIQPSVPTTSTAYLPSFHAAMPAAIPMAPPHSRAPLRRITSHSSSMRHRSQPTEASQRIALPIAGLPPTTCPPDGAHSPPQPQDPAMRPLVAEVAAVGIGGVSALALHTQTISQSPVQLDTDPQLPLTTALGLFSQPNLQPHHQARTFTQGLEVSLAPLPSGYQDPPQAIATSGNRGGLNNWDWDFDVSAFGFAPMDDAIPPPQAQPAQAQNPWLSPAVSSGTPQLMDNNELQMAMLPTNTPPAFALQDFPIGMRLPHSTMHSEHPGHAHSTTANNAAVITYSTNETISGSATSPIGADTTFPQPGVSEAWPDTRPLKKRRARRRRPDVEALRAIGVAHGRNPTSTSGTEPNQSASGGSAAPRAAPWTLAFYQDGNRTFLQSVKHHMGVYFMTEFAFPDNNATTIFRKRAWDAASIDHPHSLVWNDDIAKIVHEHGGKLRSRMKASAEIAIIGHYNLTGNTTSVLNLARDALHDSNFIHRQWTAERQTGPFRNSAIPAILNETLFRSKRGEGAKLIQHYQPFIPIPTIALACTALHCALDEIIKGHGLRTAIKFESVSYRSKYEMYLRRWSLLNGDSSVFSESTQRWITDAARASELFPDEDPLSSAVASSSTDTGAAQEEILRKVMYD